jgi:hypothetical protein
MFTSRPDRPRALDAQSRGITHRRSSCSAHQPCWQLCSVLRRLLPLPSRRRLLSVCNEARRPATCWNAAHGRSTFPINTRPWGGPCIRCRKYVGNRCFEHRLVGPSETTRTVSNRYRSRALPLPFFRNSFTRPALKAAKQGTPRPTFPKAPLTVLTVSKCS